MRKSYPSDISREQFEIIRPLLESARKKTALRKVELYEVFCAVLYLPALQRVLRPVAKLADSRPGADVELNCLNAIFV